MILLTESTKDNYNQHGFTIKQQEIQWCKLPPSLHFMAIIQVNLN